VLQVTPQVATQGRSLRYYPCGLAVGQNKQTVKFDPILEVLALKVYHESQMLLWKPTVTTLQLGCQLLKMASKVYLEVLAGRLSKDRRIY